MNLPSWMDQYLDRAEDLARRARAADLAGECQAADQLRAEYDQVHAELEAVLAMRERIMDRVATT